MIEELELFLEDMDDQLSIMEQTLLDISEISLAEIDKEMVNKLFRAMHTMKGNAGMFGYDVISKFAHIAENVLDEVRNNHIHLTQDILDLLLLVHDHSKLLVDVFTQDRTLTLEQNQTHQRLLEELSSYLKENNILPDASPKHHIVHEEESLLETYCVHVILKNDFFKSGMDMLSIIKYLNAIGNVEYVDFIDKYIPPLNELKPLNAYVQFKIIYQTTESDSEIYEAFEFVQEDVIVDVQVCEYPIFESSEKVLSVEEEVIQLPLQEIEKQHILLEKQKEYEENVELRLLTPVFNSFTLKVDSLKVDKLINQISEMVIANAKITQFALDADNSELEESVTMMSEMLEEVRDGIMNIRMVQVGDSLAKLRRVVNETAKKLNKEVQFEIIGGKTELDKMVIEKITDPLVHMLRNAIDHGIESPKKRLELGKEAKGHITLKAYPDSGSIVIKIIDDGGGINKEIIFNKAVAKGLIEANTQLSEKETFDLIFAPGFSTSEIVSDISGRGVGMDVVRQNIESLRGSVEILSSLNLGTTMTIRLPLTLAIINGFLIQSGEVKYIIPLDLIQECIELSPSREEEVNTHGYIILRDEVLPIIDISEYFEEEKKNSLRENIVIVKYGNQQVGLRVDDLYGEFQTVIKPLGELFDNVAGISGGTILGNGEIALIFDVQQLIKYKIEDKE